MGKHTKRLRVEFDGEIIECSIAADTVEKVLFKLIDKYGENRVLSADHESMLISLHQLSASSRSFRKVGRYYISRDSRNELRKRYLERIADRLRISIKVKIVPKPAENKSTPHTSSRPSVSVPSSRDSSQGETSHGKTGSGSGRHGGYGDRADILLPEEISETEGSYEGARRRISVNTYERNRTVRDKCLQHYGTRCAVCAQDMSEIYGPEATGLIHVHHLKPLSEIKEDYQVNPITDLRPVCPNCHAVIHRRKPPYKIEEVKGFLEKVKQDG